MVCKTITRFSSHRINMKQLLEIEVVLKIEDINIHSEEKGRAEGTA